MSEFSMQDRDWRFFVQDMIDFCDRVLRFTSGLDRNGFLTREVAYYATLRNLELLGVAARYIPTDVRNSHAEIEWRQIIATRNRLAHSYLSIDDDVIWDIIQSDIPVLLPKLHRLLEAYGGTPTP